ncbi:MAG: DUF3793 family protein [Clostridia bacterium]|nr:DUF3793 family protein [Clostridia bacterium]
MSEELIIRHCSPTLAGMKTANMFSCPCENAEEMKEKLRFFNRILSKKGLRLLPLRLQKGRALIYLYRPAQLGRDLQHRDAFRLLQERGYCCRTPERCIFHLRQRLAETEDFPHEIGLFLGYPPEDVEGFIQHKSPTLSGPWKVYGDPLPAQKRFDQYKKCTAVYCAKWQKGRSLEKLTVAS